jgi:two-component system sensor histidine kinase AlgZ
MNSRFSIRALLQPAASERLNANADTRAQGFLPYLCNATAVLGLVLLGELIALALVLMDGSFSTFSWTQLGYVSMVVQWIVLLSALALCPLSRPLANLPPLLAGMAAYLSVLFIALLVIAGALWLLDGVISLPVLMKYMVLAAIFSGIFLRYLYLQQQLRQQQQAELQSRIQALHARIRPHFLFNSMNAVASLIPVNPSLAEKVIEDLSEVFRTSLQQASLIPLADEIDLCRRYVAIEQVRLGERLQVNWQIQGDIPATSVPSFVLQPLIENAIYHGIQRLPEGGIVDVSMVVEGKTLQLTVRNPVPVLQRSQTDQLTQNNASGEKKTNHMALSNISHRLQAHYGSKALVNADIVKYKQVLDCQKVQGTCQEIQVAYQEVYQVSVQLPLNSHNDNSPG